MARYPNAIWKPVDRYKPGGSVHQPMPNPGRLCFHTAVSSSDSLFALFNTPGNPVAHFYVRDDGKIEQYVDTDTRASANLDGNHDTIAVESWDAGGAMRKWTERQVEACAQLAAWVHDKHNIPLERCDASPGSRGVTWHRKGIDGNFPPGLLSGRKAGDEYWTKSTGKICPFDGKILGVVNDIIPRARALAEGDWFDMATKEDLREVVDNALASDEFQSRIRRIVDNALDDDHDGIALRVKRSLLDETDVFPNNAELDVTVRDLFARLYGHTEPAS